MDIKDVNQLPKEWAKACVARATALSLACKLAKVTLDDHPFTFWPINGRQPKIFFMLRLNAAYFFDAFCHAESISNDGLEEKYINKALTSIYKSTEIRQTYFDNIIFYREFLVVPLESVAGPESQLQLNEMSRFTPQIPDK